MGSSLFNYHYSRKLTILFSVVCVVFIMDVHSNEQFPGIQNICGHTMRHHQRAPPATHSATFIISANQSKYVPGYFLTGKKFKWSCLNLKFHKLLLPPAKKLGKVIFSVACVKNSVHGGGSTWQVPPGQVSPPGQVPPGQVHPLVRYTPQGRYTPPRQAPLGRYTPWAGTPPRQVHPQQVPPLQRYPLAGTPQGSYTSPPDNTGYGQWAGGTHPTGMHSCFLELLKFLP